ncbi:PVC-type heme-binding CxxCH protein [Glaciecola petra]|uniref:C-type cytochrome n=1 Tax=Glaciecola petra TaxID=3075602 RepID=A0ABU2ZQ17_9ALTE|nr:PVC-type heme-binding CxxCH protein [Aestuariibacter sp. P117]MDT0593557.1 c-type cytochrome [Aestuariibacter sp. P117]
MKSRVSVLFCLLPLLLLSQAVMAFNQENKVAEKSAFKGDREGHVMKDPIDKKDIPPAPILTVAQALESMHVADGFVLENIISEPNIFNPVALAFDPDGRIWVAEMTRFMPDIKGTGEEVPEGNIAILEDTTGDGKLDTRTVFLNDVILPRTISIVEGGIFYADHTQLYFTEVVERDGVLVPGIREVADSEYAAGGNLEHKPNAMMYNIDNWYYNAKSSDRYKAVPMSHSTTSLPQSAKEIYRNKFWRLYKDKTDFRGQWGVTHDDFGRLYHNKNHEPISGEYLLPGSLRTNPEFKASPTAHLIGEKSVFPVRINPGVNRAYIDGVLVGEGENKGKLANFTAASGSLIYRGDNFPEDLYGLALTPEPAGNLISARRLLESEGQLSGVALLDKAEIIASTDERFRPVNLHNAPDGSIYIVDFYHGIIQHKEFLTSYLGKQIKDRELDQNNNSMGRLYRLRWNGKALPQPQSLSLLSTDELVPLLAHKNGWHRDTARRLIVQTGAVEQAKAVLDLIKNSHDERVIINGLWTLNGLERLNYEILNHFMRSGTNKVKASAIALSAYLPQRYHSELLKTLAELIETDYYLALQAALISGKLASKDSVWLSKKILDLYAEKPYVLEAVVSGFANNSKQFTAELAQYPNAEFRYIVDNLGKDPSQRNNRNQLATQGITLYDQGKTLYNGKGACSACHGADGNGIDGMGPTFWQSEWVITDKQRLAKVLLHGLSGPITVNGEQWKTNMVMPGYANNPVINDEELAAIATYLRNTWGNAADIDGQVSVELFKKVREETTGQTTPYQQDDF